MTKRDAMIRPVTIVASVAALISIGVAMACRESAVVGYITVGAWTLAPPVWFMYEWVVLTREVEDVNERERVKHLQDLARNIWIALVAMLILLFRLNGG